jgi:hypothetical protein
LVPTEQSIDVSFETSVENDLATVEQMYATAGVELTSRCRRELEAYSNANPRAKHGRVVYDLAGDFGVNLGELRERFQFYLDRFSLTQESLTPETVTKEKR